MVILAADNVPDIVVWAPVASAALLAITAIASLRTARIASREFRRGSRPHLDVVFIVPQPSGPLQIAVRNIGGGSAKAPIVLAEVEGAGLGEFLGDGLLGPGDGFKITTMVDAGDVGEGEYRAVAGCRDFDDVFRAWSTHWETREFRDLWRRPIRTVDWDEAFQKFYPGVGLAEKPKIPFRIEPL